MSLVKFPKGQRIKDEIDRPAGQAFADLLHEQQVGRSRKHKTKFSRIAIHGALDGHQQIRGFLDFIQNDPIRACPQSFRIPPGLGKDIEFIQAVITPIPERFGVEQQRALANLARPGQNDDGMIPAGLLQGGGIQRFKYNSIDE